METSFGYAQPTHKHSPVCLSCQKRYGPKKRIERYRIKNFTLSYIARFLFLLKHFNNNNSNNNLTATG